MIPQTQNNKVKHTYDAGRVNQELKISNAHIWYLSDQDSKSFSVSSSSERLV